jgi:hypothetical protein
MTRAALDAIREGFEARRVVTRRGTLTDEEPDHRARRKAVNAFIEILNLFDAADQRRGSVFLRRLETMGGGVCQ